MHILWSFSGALEWKTKCGPYFSKIYKQISRYVKITLQVTKRSETCFSNKNTFPLTFTANQTRPGGFL